MATSHNPRMSFAESFTWASLGALLLATVWYSWALSGAAESGPVEISQIAAIGAVATVILIVVHIGGAIASVAYTRSTTQDERDRLIEMRSDARGGVVLGFGVVLTVLDVLFPSILPFVDARSTATLINLLLASLVVAEVAGSLVKLVAYRRGL